MFSHFLGPDAKKAILVEEVVRVSSGFNRRVHEVLHGSTNDLVGDLVVVVTEFVEGRLPIAVIFVIILVGMDTEGCGQLDEKGEHVIEVFVSPVELGDVACVGRPSCSFE